MPRERMDFLYKIVDFTRWSSKGRERISNNRVFFNLKRKIQRYLRSYHSKRAYLIILFGIIWRRSAFYFSARIETNCRGTNAADEWKYARNLRKLNFIKLRYRIEEESSIWPNAFTSAAIENRIVRNIGGEKTNMLQFNLNKKKEREEKRRGRKKQRRAKRIDRKC